MKNKKLILKLSLCTLLFATMFILSITITVFAAGESPYGVYVGGVAVTNDNKDDVLSDGKIVYTPQVGEKPAVLTFNDNCEIAGITCTTNDIVITSGSVKPVTITLTKPMLLGNNNENNTITIKGNSETNTLTIKPKQTDGVNTFRPIGIRSGNTLLLENNIILENSHGTAFGGGMINVAKDATLEMKGGIIQNSKATSTIYDNISVYLGRGGAIYVAEGGTFKMSGGEIKNCSATVAGGAVYSAGTIEITGGQINNCSVSGLVDDKDTNNIVKAKGGAMYIFKGKFTMTGGEISDNTLEKVDEMRGAGVYAASGVAITLGGTAKIENNKDGKNNNSNLFLYDGVEFNISSDKKPETEMKVYITTKTSPTENNAIKLSTNGTENDKQYIISDSDNYAIEYNKEGFLELKNSYKITVNVNNEAFGSATATPNNAPEGTIIGLQAIPNSGYHFVRWESTDVDAETGTFNMLAKNITVTAIFEKDPPTIFTVTFDSNGGSKIQDKEVIDGNCVLKPDDPTKENMVFDGWYIDDALTTKFDFNTKITANITLYAKWIQEENMTEETKQEETNPKTGDIGIELLISLMLLSIMGIIGTNIILKKRD